MHSRAMNVVADAVASAIHLDLSDINLPPRKLGNREMPASSHRPYEDHLEIYMFPETWANTALGYGGVGGNMITSDYTVIVLCRSTDEACIYWGAGGRLGRKLNYSKGRECARACSTQIKPPGKT